MQECFHSNTIIIIICEWLNMLKKPNRNAKGIYFTTRRNFSSRFCVTLLLFLPFWFYFFVTLKKLCEKPIILAMSYSCVLFRGPFFFIISIWHQSPTCKNIYKERERERDRARKRRKSQEIMDFCAWILALSSRTPATIDAIIIHVILFSSFSSLLCLLAEMFHLIIIVKKFFFKCMSYGNCSSSKNHNKWDNRNMDFSCGGGFV